MNSWLFLSSAIVFELLGTIFLKISNGFSKLSAVILIAIFYGLSFYTFSLALRKIDLGLAYAIWAGCGTILVSLIGFCFFREPFSILKIISMVIIVTGIVGLHLSDATQ